MTLDPIKESRVHCEHAFAFLCQECGCKQPVESVAASVAHVAVGANAHRPMLQRQPAAPPPH